jgi:hypothetical protein
MECVKKNFRVVLSHNGTGEGQDACFCFVIVQNRGTKIAKNVVPHVSIDLPEWKDLGLMPLLVIPRPAYPIHLIDWPDEKGESRFADALTQSEGVRKGPMSLDPNGVPENFTLFFTVKDDDALYIPTAGVRPTYATYPASST